jgi:hypothetical protein
MATEPATAPEASDDSAAPDARRRRNGMIATITAAVLLVAAIVTAAIMGTVSGGANAPATPSSTATPSATGDAEQPEPSESSSAPDDEAVDPSVPADPVEITQPADISPGLTAAITNLESVSGEAQRPGEVAGPAVRVTVQITNATDAAVQLLTTVVTAYYGDEQTPALELGAPGASAMPTEVAAGETATGVYVFTVPADERDLVRVMVDYSVDVRPLVFEGAVPE